MKKKFGLLGVLAALLLAPVLTTGCPDTNKDTGGGKSDKALLTDVKVAKTGENLQVDYEAGDGIAPDEWIDWIEDGTPLEAEYGTLAIETFASATGSLEGKLTLSLSAKAKARVTGMIASAAQPEAEDWSPYTAGMTYTFEENKYFYVEVTAENSTKKTYYQILVELGSYGNHADRPTFSAQPAASTTYTQVKNGANITVTPDKAALTATAAAPAPGQVTYQWYYSATAITEAEGGDELAGGTSASYNLDNIDVTAAGDVGDHYYYVIATNTDSSKDTTTATRASNVVKVTVVGWSAGAPSITAQPVPAVYISQNDTSPPSLTVTAASPDGGTLEFQWYTVPSTGEPVAVPTGGTTNTLVLTSATQGVTTYQVTVINVNNDAIVNKRSAPVTSGQAVVTVGPPYTAGADFLVDFGSVPTRLQISTTTGQSNYRKGRGFALAFPPAFNIAAYDKVTIKYAYFAPNAAGTGAPCSATTASYYIDAYFFEPWNADWFAPGVAVGTEIDGAANGAPPDSALPAGVLQRVGGRTGVADVRIGVMQSSDGGSGQNPTAPSSGWATWNNAAASATSTADEDNLGFTYKINHTTFNKNPGGLWVNKGTGNNLGDIQILQIRFHNELNETDPNFVRPITSITVAPDTLEMPIGGTASAPLTVAILPANATQEFTVAWESNTPGIATVDQDGKVTPVAAGLAIIKATATVSDGSGGGPFTAECTVTVKTIPLTGITLNKSSLSLVVNGTETLTALPVPSNTSDTWAVTWASDTLAVATVDPTSGLVTAVAVGTAKITATVTGSNPAKTAQCTVNVKEPSNTYSITGNGTETTASTTFTATKILNADGTPANTAVKTNVVLGEALDAIREAANGAGVTIQFGDGESKLNVGDTIVSFGNPEEGIQWGEITITGKITGNRTGESGTITIGAPSTTGSVSAIFDAMIYNTNTGGTSSTANNTAGSKALTINTSGTVEIIGGEITAGSGVATANSGSAIYILGPSTVTISGGTITSCNPAGSRTYFSGTIYHGGTGMLTITGTAEIKNLRTGNIAAVTKEGTGSQLTISGGTFTTGGTSNRALYVCTAGVMNLGGDPTLPTIYFSVAGASFSVVGTTPAFNPSTGKTYAVAYTSTTVPATGDVIVTGGAPFSTFFTGTNVGTGDNASDLVR
jgi:uncharacterized protein YjdB/uncharacterized protein YaiE (UPF0345 family)